MTEYWLISAPGDKTCQQTWDTMNNLTSKQNPLSSNYKFHIPDLKVGTLDQLVGLSDDLGKLDTFVEQVTRKVAAYLGEVLEDQRDKLQENLMANNIYKDISWKLGLDYNVTGIGQTSVEGESSSPEEDLDASDISLSNEHSNTAVMNKCKKDSSNCYDCRHNYNHQYQRQHQYSNSHRHNKQRLDDDDTCSTINLGQHHQQNDRYKDYHNPHNHSSYNHHHHQQLNDNKKTSSNSNSHTYDDNQSNESSLYSCYHVHWCVTSASSSPSPSPSPIPTPTSPTPSPSSFSSDCSSDGEQSFHRRYNHKLQRNISTSSKSIPDDKDYDTTNHQHQYGADSQHRQTDHHHHHHHHHHHRQSGLSTDDSIEHHSDEDDSNEQDQLADNSGKLPNPGDLPTYITRFQWDMAKYPIKQSLRNIADIISKQVGQIDADLKTKSTTYNNLKGSLQNLEKKQTGSLLTRNLADLVKKEHFILDSEYLSTLLVIVPKTSFQEWHSIYEKLTDMIVPRSTMLITQDSEYGLFTVTLFKKVVEEFKLHAREKKFIVRDFTYNEEELAAGKNEITKLVTDKKKQFGPLVRWLKVNFSECFCAWIHVKALRVFVESVLRYGLPVNFQAILLHPSKKCAKRLRDVLNQLYAHLDSSASGQSGNQDSVDIPGLGFGQNEYYPYVYYKINVDMVDNKI